MTVVTMSVKREPSAEELEAIRSGLSKWELRKRYNLRQDTIDRWFAKLGPAPVEDIDPLSKEELRSIDDWGALWGAVAAHIRTKKQVDKDVTSVKVDWGNDLTGLLLPSDFHIGSDWCDMDGLQEDMRYIGNFRREYPDILHLAHLGDPIDGFMPVLGSASGGMLEEAETRLDRQEGLFLYVARMAGNWDVLLYGCHEAWTLTKTGRDPISPLAVALSAQNGGYGVILEVSLGSEVYRIVLRHKTRRESSLNTTNAQRVLDDDLALNGYGSRADAVCLSHLHTNDLQVRRKAGRQVTYTRSGAYKGGDCFARAGAYIQHKTPDKGFPLLILHPSRHDILAFDGRHWKQGLDYLASQV